MVIAMRNFDGMGSVLGLGVLVGLSTAVWSLWTGGSLFLALLAYSVGGTACSLLVAVCIAAVPETRRLPLIAR